MPYIDKTEILFIINPNSGKKNPNRIIQQIKNVDSCISCIVTKDTKELERVLQHNIEKFKVFVAVGGDGTVNEIMKHLFNNKEKVLAVFPNGSGNGFANELNFNTNIKSLIDDIIKGETIFIDVLEVNNNKCINITGLGLDSFVAHDFQRCKDRGLKNYIISTIKSILLFKPFNAVITTSKNEISGKFQLISVANTRQFGNNFVLSPASKPNDGIFEIVLIKPFPIYFYPIFIVRMLLANLKDSQYINYIEESDSISISSEYKKYHVDGEPYLTEGILKIKMCKNSIQIIKTSHNK